MDWLREMIFEMDWKQFIPSLVATVIGIFGPFWIQSRIEKSKRRKDALVKVKQLKSELKSMLKTIKSLEDNMRYIDPIKTPIWTGLQNTNESSLLSVLHKKPKELKIKKNNSGMVLLEVEENANTKIKQTGSTDESDSQANTWYNIVYSLYGRIEEYNKWWNLYSTQRAAGRKLDDLHAEKSCIAELKEKLCSETLIEENVVKENKDGIPFLLNLLDVVIAVNTPIMHRFFDKVRKIFRKNRQKDK